VKIALRVFAGAAVLALVIWYVDPRSLARSLAGVDPWLFAAAVGVAILSNVVSALRWSAIAHRLGLSSSTRNSLLMYARAITANMMLPGSLVSGATVVDVSQFPGGVKGTEGGYIQLLDQLVNSLGDTSRYVDLKRSARLIV
jgi:uncharacterized membrane protein YbhN (UPF0104 family)